MNLLHYYRSQQEKPQHSKVAIVLVFGLALLILTGCGQSKSGKAPQANNNGIPSAPSFPGSSDSGSANVSPYANLRMTAVKDIQKECSAVEVNGFKALEKKLQTANAKVDSANGQKSDSALQEAASAVSSCDAVIADQKSSACKFTTRTIINPTGVIEYYDAYRTAQKCQKVENYTLKFKARPSVGQAGQQAPPPKNPQTPPPANPSQPSQPSAPQVTGNLKQCSGEEFSRLTTGMAWLDKANSRISAQGNAWKYDANAVSDASQATKACEPLIQYHTQNPCQKATSSGTKQYTKETLEQRCKTARTYYYEYVQNKSTLNFKNADLYLDVNSFGPRYFDADSVTDVQGCRIENPTSQAIDYRSTNKALVKSSRGFESKMMVLETEQGLLVQCYGLNIGSAFSKREIERVLKNAGSNISLIYILK